MICPHGASTLFALQCPIDDCCLERKTEPEERLPCCSQSSESVDLLWRGHFKNLPAWLNAQTNPERPDNEIPAKLLQLNCGQSASCAREELRSRQVQPEENKKDGDLGVHKKIAGTFNREEVKEEVSIESYVSHGRNCDKYREGHILVTLLKSCANQKDLQRGSEIHSCALRRGVLDGNVYLGSALINMYAKCGALGKAQDVFDSLACRNVVSWNVLIGSYAHYGLGKEALRYFEYMMHESISPDTVTFACALKACGSLRDMDKGLEIHAQIVKNQLLKDNVLLANAVLDMYVKCGALEKAQDVFDELQLRDVFSWTILIAGYIHHGFMKDAFNLYDMMHEKGVIPIGVTFVCMLKACGSMRALDRGEKVHDRALKANWLEKDIIVANAVVDMYAKCGALKKAKEVFDKLANHDVVSWTALITGYVQHEQGEQALNCYKRMQLEGFCPNSVTFSCLLKACGILEALDSGQLMHAKILQVGLLEKDTVVANALIDMYSKCGVLAKAQHVFNELRNRDVVSWTSMIVGYVDYELGEEALKCFEQMQSDGFTPDAITFACVLKACGSIGATKKGQDLHILVLQNNLLEENFLVANALVDMYAKCGSLAKAQEVFDGLRNRDVVTWNALLSGYVQHECYEAAFNCFERMQLEGFFPDAFTFACALKMCGGIGALQLGQRIHSEVVRYGIIEIDMVVGTGLVDMYANCGLLAETKDVFYTLPVRNVVSWSAFIEGYAQLGKDQLVIYTLEKMIQDGGLPDSITLTIILNACSHRGLLDKGQNYFEIITRVYSMTPHLEHYTCMVDLFGRAGHFDVAALVIKEMPTFTNLRVLHTLLGACRNWGNMSIGRWAFNCSVRLDGEDGGSFVGMSNIYGAFSGQEDVVEICGDEDKI